jgi:orotidine-5'-phosphate decarboxylase
MSAPRFHNPIFAALDTPDLPRALEIAKAIRPHVGGLKVGLEFITALGPDAVKEIVKQGSPVFADVKFHDIPNTVAGASKAIAGLGVSIFNVHTSGGEAMMRAAVEAGRGVDHRRHRADQHGR